MRKLGVLIGIMIIVGGFVLHYLPQIKVEINKLADYVVGEKVVTEYKDKLVYKCNEEEQNKFFELGRGRTINGMIKFFESEKDVDIEERKITLNILDTDTNEKKQITISKYLIE